MPRCSGCNAPIAPETPTCPYCGFRNAVDLDIISGSTTETPEGVRICPNCNVKLKTVDIGESGSHFYIEVCESCGGMFFDNGELEAILDDKVRGVHHVSHQELSRLISKPLDSTLKVVYRKCPICSDIMNRKKFGEKSGVVIDICNHHGVWLEAGELTRLVEWKKAGGEILDAKRKYEDEARRLKEQRAKASNSRGDSMALDTEFNFGGSKSRSRRGGRGLYTTFDIIDTIIDLFIR